MSPAITIDSLKAALAKLDANVSVEDILSAIEPEPMHSLSDIGPSCAACAARATQNSPPNPLESTLTPISDPQKSVNFPPLSEEGRRRILHLVEEAYPNGVPPHFPFPYGICRDTSPVTGTQG